MPESLSVKQIETIVDELERMHELVARRAYEIFESNGHGWGRDLDDWLTAERELVWAPAAEVEEHGDEIKVKLAASGLDAKDLEVEVTPEDLLVKGETHREREKKKGKVRAREQTSAKLFRSLHLPKRIDPASAKAELKDGMLEFTARVAKERQPRKLKIASA